MSHLHQRQEKDCLNCGTTIIGRYCHNCGQENIEPKESVWHLLSHFFNDVTHFDGKFFISMKDLILRPGFLSKEYMIGKRATYLNPIRMYLFTSFIFFLVFFSLYKPNENVVDVKATKDQINKMDSSDVKDLSAQINNGKPMTKEELGKKFDSSNIVLFNGDFKTRKEFDSAIKKSPNKYGWVSKLFIYKGLELNEKYKYNKRQAITDIIEKMEHSIPQILFVLLPLFALILKLLYVRHKDFYYTNHAIFTIHFYVFAFIAMLLIFGFNKIEKLTSLSWISYINVVLVLGIFYYLFRAMLNFYKQGVGKTILKYIFLIITFSIICLIQFVVLMLISVFRI